MPTKKAKKKDLSGHVVIAPDGQLYFVSQQEARVARAIKHALSDCMDAFNTVATCLKKHGLFTSDEVVLSGVMTKANSKLLSPKRVARRSAKK